MDDFEEGEELLLQSIIYGRAQSLWQYYKQATMIHKRMDFQETRWTPNMPQSNKEKDSTLEFMWIKVTNK